MNLKYRQTVVLFLIAINTRMEYTNGRYRFKTITIPSMPTKKKYLYTIDGYRVYETDHYGLHGYCEHPNRVYLSRMALGMGDFILLHEIAHLKLNHRSEQQLLLFGILLIESLFKRRSLIRAIGYLYGIWFPVSRMFEYEADALASIECKDFEWLNRMEVPSFKSKLFPSHPSFSSRYSCLKNANSSNPNSRSDINSHFNPKK